MATKTAEQIKKEMAANSANWHTADAATKKKLEQQNAAYRNQLSGMGQSVSYDSKTGVTSDSKGKQLYDYSKPTNQNTGAPVNIPTNTPTNTPTNKAAQTTYYDPSGKQQTGYIIGGKTYKDAGGTQRIDTGSVVKTAGGYYKMGDSGSSYVGAEYTPQAPEKTYTPPSGSRTTTITRGGKQISGYIVGDKTYDEQGNRVVAGDVIDGKWLMTDAGRGVDVSTAKTGIYGKDSNMDIPLLDSVASQAYMLDDQYYDAATGKLAGAGFVDQGDGTYRELGTGRILTREEISKTKNIYETNKYFEDYYNTSLESINAAIAAKQAELQGVEQQGQQALDNAAAQSEISSFKNLDNLALRRAQMGDLGGIGQKQYSEAANAHDKRLLEIALEKKNLEQSTKQEVAKLEAEGKIAEAQMTAELGAKQLEILINEEDKLNASLRDQEMTSAQYLGSYKGQPTLQAQNMATNNALTRLQLGIFSEQDALALGIPPDAARNFTDRINLLAQLDINTAQAQIKKLLDATPSQDINSNPFATTDVLAENPDVVKALDNAYYIAFVKDANVPSSQKQKNFSNIMKQYIANGLEISDEVFNAWQDTKKNLF